MEECLSRFKYQTQVLIHYYPNLVNKIIVYEMPWIMNAAWKVIKSLLPGPAQERIKFCTKSSIGDYAEVETVPLEQGGQEDWTYRWEPEISTPPVPLESANGNIGEHLPFSLIPCDRLLFRQSTNSTGELEAVLSLESKSDNVMAYKIRSTRPSLFVVSK